MQTLFYIACKFLIKEPKFPKRGNCAFNDRYDFAAKRSKKKNLGRENYIQEDMETEYSDLLNEQKIANMFEIYDRLVKGKGEFLMRT